MAVKPTYQQGRRSRPRVVVIGAGFAGLAAVRELSVADVDVLLIDRNGYNTFQPLLYQVATGGLNPGDVTYALRAFCSRYRNASFRRAEVTGVDTAARQVQLADVGPVEYDYLVVCAGVATNYFGVPGAPEHSMSIYTRGGAIAVRDRVMSSLEAAAQQRAGVEPVVVIVGGGATGVEMAGAFAELRNAALPVAYPEIDRSRVRVVLVEMTDAVLSPFAPRLRDYAAEELRARGVELMLAASVREVRDDSVLVGREGQPDEVIPSVATVWATGVTATSVVGDWGLPTGRGGRITTGADLRVEGLQEVFAVGDVAASVQDPTPQLAQPAIQGGVHAAVQIRRLLAGDATQDFRYKNKGTMATIGRSDAVVELPVGLKLRGTIAWLAWLGLHVVTLVGNRNRVATLANLSVRYFTWPRSLNVIIGDPPR